MDAPIPPPLFPTTIYIPLTLAISSSVLSHCSQPNALSAICALFTHLSCPHISHRANHATVLCFTVIKPGWCTLSNHPIYYLTAQLSSGKSYVNKLIAILNGGKDHTQSSSHMGVLQLYYYSCCQWSTRFLYCCCCCCKKSILMLFCCCCYRSHHTVLSGIDF